MRMNPFRPHASFFFTLLFFAGLTAWYIHTKPEINTKTADLIHLAAVLESEQSSSPKKPKILVAGSSFAGMGIHIGAIEKAAGLPAAKIAMNAGTPLDTFGIFENYGNILTKNTEILIIELAAFQFGQKQKDIRRTFFTKIKNAGRTFMPQDIAAWAAFVS
ncbi:MAG: hypothetical protein LBH00_00870, partial [Planctomycetaceae bacterium]|nr:hypothetical protein [Planctomycetaceae bacterium]